jgi:hypothetical protein
MTATHSGCRSLFVVEAKTLAIEEQRAEPVLVEVPVAHRSGVDMEEPGMGVPADAATMHRPCREHRFGESCPKTYVECAAVEMLAVFGDPERGALQHRVGLERPIGGEDACALRINCIHHRNEKIYDGYINFDRRRGMKVAQEH